MRAEPGFRLIYGEAGSVGGEFEEDAAWLAEVDGTEDFLSWTGVTVSPDRRLPPAGDLVRLVGYPEGDVMDRAYAEASVGKAGAPITSTVFTGPPHRRSA